MAPLLFHHDAFTVSFRPRRRHLKMRISSIVCSLLCWMSVSISLADDVLWIVSAANQAGGPAELVRMEDGRAGRRIELGRNVAYGTARLQFVAASTWEGQERIRSWDLRTGEKKTDSPISGQEVPFMRTMAGACRSLFFRDSDGQVLYNSFYDAEVPVIIDGKRLVMKKPQMGFAGVELASGKAYQVKPPKGIAQGVEWMAIGDRVGLRLRSGSIALFDFRTRSFAETLPLKGVKGPWNVYLPDVGLAEWTPTQLNLVTDQNLHPLAETRKVSIVQVNKASVFQDVCKGNDGSPMLFSVERLNAESCKVVLHDMINGSNVFEKTYPIAATTAAVARTGRAWYLADLKSKRVLYVNRDVTTGEQSGAWDISWSSLPHLVAAFAD